MHCHPASARPAGKDLAGVSRADPSHGDLGRHWSRSRCPLAEKPQRTRLHLNPGENLMAEFQIWVLSHCIYIIKRRD